ncbi:hypothetical protein MMC29_001652 [Sticta canariensis]|nr:hypothetical protein [Sticta canariensis]
MEKREQQRLNEEDEKSGEETQWRISVAIQKIIYGQQFSVERAAKGENSREIEDKQSWEGMEEKAMDDRDEIQEKLQPLFEDEVRKMRAEREPSYPRARPTEEQKVIRKVICHRSAKHRERAAKDEKWRLEIQSKRERGGARKWPIPRACLPELTAEQMKRAYCTRRNMKRYAARRAAELEKSKRKMEVKEPTASASQLPTTEIPLVGALKQPLRLASMNIKFILNEQ